MREGDIEDGVERAEAGSTAVGPIYPAWMPGDHQAERLRKHAEIAAEVWTHRSFLGRVKYVSAYLVSGGIGAAITGASVGAHGPVSMTVFGGLIAGANAVGILRSVKASHKAELRAADVLLGPWVTTADKPSQIMDSTPPLEYDDPADGWKAVARLRKEFPQFDENYWAERPLLGMSVTAQKALSSISLRRLQRVPSEEKSISTASVLAHLVSEYVIRYMPDEYFPVGAELHPELEAKLERIGDILAEGVSGTEERPAFFDITLPGDGGTPCLARLTLAPERKITLVPLTEELRYPDPEIGWRALDRLRDPARACFFPEIAAALPPISDDERAALTELDDLVAEAEERFPESEDIWEDILADAELASRVESLDARLVSEEARLRSDPGDPGALAALANVIEGSLQIVLANTPAEAFPLPVDVEQVHPELLERLDRFMGQIGAGSAPRSVYSVYLNREDGRSYKIDYIFPGDGKFDSAVTLLDASAEQVRLAAYLQAVGVPETPPLTYPDASAAWRTVDTLVATFPIVAAVVQQLTATGQVTREGEQAQAAAEAVIGQALQAVIQTSPEDDLDVPLGTFAAIAGYEAAEGSALNVRVADGVVQYTVVDSGAAVKAVVYRPGAKPKPIGRIEAPQPEMGDVPPAAAAPAPARLPVGGIGAAAAAAAKPPAPDKGGIS